MSSSSKIFFPASPLLVPFPFLDLTLRVPIIFFVPIFLSLSASLFFPCASFPIVHLPVATLPVVQLPVASLDVVQLAVASFSVV